MKILHCLNHYLPDQIAGTEIYVSALIKALSAKNVISKVIIPNYQKNENLVYFFDKEEVIRYAEPSVPDRDLITGRKKPAGLSFFESVIRAEKPDIVHFHELAGSNGISIHHVIAARRAGFKTVMTFHVAKYSCRTGTLMYMNEKPCDGIIRTMRCSRCSMQDKGMGRPAIALLSTASELLERIGYDTRKWNNTIGTALSFPFIIKKFKEELIILQDNCDALVAISGWYKEVLLRNGIMPQKLNLIKQALPLPFTGNISSKTISPVLRVVFIGRINHFKGILLLIRAMKAMSPSGITLDIYGSLDDEAYVSLCKKEAEGMDNILWKGIVPPQNVVQVVAEYDLFCLPSAVCEMSPLVIQESFAAGVPVLASDVYGNAEQISENQNGWFFKFKDVESLKNKLKILSDNPEMIKTASSYLHVLRSFANVAEEYIGVYNKILTAG